VGREERTPASGSGAKVEHGVEDEQQSHRPVTPETAGAAPVDPATSLERLFSGMVDRRCSDGAAQEGTPGRGFAAAC